MQVLFVCVFVFYKKRRFWLSFYILELKYNKIPECTNVL